MTFYILCWAVLVFYVVIWFFDSFFKSCMNYPYYAFMEGTGLKVGILNFSWTTTAFNRCIYRWSKFLGRPLKKWFTFGYIITILLFLPFSLWTLFSFIIEQTSSNISVDHVPEVTAVLPGVNIPLEDFWVYFIAIGFSSVFHELGHAIAAAQEDVPIYCIGFYVFIIIPIAFVQLGPEQLNALTIGKRLRIYCAGVWHNIASAFVAMVLFFTAPILFSLMYDIDMGVKVIGFTLDSPLQHARGLVVGDIVTSLNGCAVRNSKDWMHCLHMAHNRFGICTDADLVINNDMSNDIEYGHNVANAKCCKNKDPLNLCFEYMPPRSQIESTLPAYHCLKPRDMLKDGMYKCMEENDYQCPHNSHCMKPSLGNQTYFIVIDREDMAPVLYLGIPYDLLKSVTVDQYFPKLKFFSVFSPVVIEKLLRYIFVFSTGIAFLNVVPCYGTDGHYIARNLIQLLARILNKSESFSVLLTSITVITGTLLTVPMLIILFYNAITD